MSTHLPSKLHEFLEPIFSGECSPRFGHIRVPPYCYGTESLMESMRVQLKNIEVSGHMDIPGEMNQSGAMEDEEVLKFRRPLLFVVPNVERDLLNSENEANDDSSITPAILSFSELLDALKTAKLMATEEESWATSHTWESGQPIPDNIVLVLCLDPLMSAECALCLVGLVKWATQQSEDSANADICVLTVSAEPSFNFLAEVVSFTSPGTHVANLDLAALGEKEPTGHSPAREDQCYAAQILEKFQGNRDRKRLIVSFGSKLEPDFKSMLSERETGLVDFVKVTATQDARPLLNLARSDEGPKTLFITFIGEVPFQPLDLEGFDELHVALGSNPFKRMEWEDFSRQVISALFHASQEDRQLQRWWIHQPSIPFRYLYVGAADVKNFIEEGPSRNRLVEDVQLGGFIASLADIASWGIDTGKALSCFVRQNHRVHEMSLRLHVQRVLKQDCFGLSGHEANVFRAILPTLGYDHRLALLVALDAEPNVRRVKVQLAVMLKHGMNRILSFNGKATNDSTEYNKLLKECHGLGSSMASKGVMWLSLGILKRHQKSIEKHGVYNPTKDRLSSLVRIDTGKAEVVGAEVGKMLALLAENGIHVDTTQSVAQETDVLSLQEQDMVSLHLLRAYANSLIVSQDCGRNGAPRMSHKVVSTWIDSRMIRAAELHERNSKPVKQGEFQFGICHEMWLERGKHDLLDWTSIPAKTVAQWRSSFGQNMTLNDLLDLRVQPEGVVE
ncbi:hypothetical protein FPRO05_10728 [Fusarium proliferatum]|uniref:Uncharacterized protein n=1 Tax=Gibberella intermedia TaxID=948311 RepID=A0A365NCA1_GIBIN|nr:hypothetical protein FPRO05_10728 [Fusarium proliferatum]